MVEEVNGKKSLRDNKVQGGREKHIVYTSVIPSISHEDHLLSVHKKYPIRAVNGVVNVVAGTPSIVKTTPLRGGGCEVLSRVETIHPSQYRTKRETVPSTC